MSGNVTNNQLMAKLVEIQKENAVRDEVIKQLVASDKRNTETLNGNGKPGLKTQVELMAASLNSLVAWNRIIGGIAGAQVVGLLFLILTHQIEFP